MNKIFLIIVMSFLTFNLFANKDYDPRREWEDNLRYTLEDIEEIKEWDAPEEVRYLIDQLLELKQSKVNLFKELLSSKKKHNEEIEMDIRLIAFEIDLLYLKIKANNIKNRDPIDNHNEEVELIEDLISVKEEMLELKVRENEIQKQLFKINKKRKIEELKRELEGLEG